MFSVHILWAIDMWRETEFQQHNIFQMFTLELSWNISI